MGLRERYRQLPPNPLRPKRGDVFIGVAGALISGMGAVADATKRVRMPGEVNRTIALTVADRRVVARDQDVIALTLVGEQLPRWHPGAHIDVHLPSGLVRQYSLCGDPAIPDTYRIAVRRIPQGGGGSIEMHDLRVGATVTTNGPRNAFPLTVPGYGSPARRFRFIAGGIGITPILPMLGLAQRLGVDWSMVYAGRSRDSLPFVDEVARFGKRIDDPHRRHRWSSDSSGVARRLSRWHRGVRVRARADADGDPVCARRQGQRRTALRAVRRAAGRRRHGVLGVGRVDRSRQCGSAPTRRCSRR